jgi:hypothetical protein
MISSESILLEDGFICPNCGFKLSLFKVRLTNNNLGIWVNCEMCDTYDGFVIDLKMDTDDLPIFDDKKKKSYTATIHNLIWDEFYAEREE